MTAAAQRFRALHRPGEPLLLPNAWDVASAAALARSGFAAVGTTSLGVAAVHGLPDAEGQAGAPTRALARRLVALPCPVTVDLESGFSADPVEVAGLAAELSAMGVAGINLEDGRPGGTLADPAAQAELLSEVKAAAGALFLNARVDTHWLASGAEVALRDTLRRVEAYQRAGADGIFVPGRLGEAEIATLAREIAVPLNVLFIPGSHSVARLAELGVGRISTGSLLFRAALHAGVRLAEEVRGDAEPAAAPPGYADVQRLLTRWA